MSWIAVGIGAAVGAASGAAIGSKKGGDDVWKGALIGGALGAAGGGAGSAAFGGAGAAAEGGIGAGALEGGSGLALGGAGLETGGAMGIGGAELGGAGAIGEAGAGTGILSSGQLAGGTAGSSAFGSAAPSSSLVGTQGFGGATSSLGSTYGVSPAAMSSTMTGTPQAFGAASGVPSGAFSGTGGATVGEVGGLAPQATGEVAKTAGQSAAKDAATQGGLSGWWKSLGAGEQAAIMGAGTAGLGYAMQQDSNKYGVPEQDEYSGPLTKLKYDPSKYTPTAATPNVYSARYAEGGIAMLADGGMNPMQNSIYPQSQQEHTNFATSSQYPNSMMSAMNADYDTRTNPMTSQELPIGMAAGGIARFGLGGNIADSIRGMQPGGAGGDYANKVYATAHPGGFMGDLQEQIVPGGTVGTVLDASVPGREEYLRRKREGEAQSSFATGGISSLGGYSDGGQLLRGPGDGVSDSIPASIGNKQPARLADGEFVVPARAVSELGNGSTDAGAKQLYAMLDRIQNKRKKGKGLAYQSTPKKMMPV